MPVQLQLVKVLTPKLVLQSLKKLSQCFAILERLTCHKSDKLYNILKIICIIV